LRLVRREQDRTREALRSVQVGTERLRKLRNDFAFLFFNEGMPRIPSRESISLRDLPERFDRRLLGLEPSATYTPEDLAKLGLGENDLRQARIPKLPGDSPRYYGASVVGWARVADSTIRKNRIASLQAEYVDFDETLIDKLNPQTDRYGYA